MAFRLYPYPKAASPALACPEPRRGRKKKARRAKHALSGFQEADLRLDTDLASVLGSVTPCARGQD